MLKSVCLHINNQCNLQCLHCWSNSGPNGKNVLDMTDIMSFIRTLMPLGLQRVSLSGGEPLLHPEIADIVKELIDKKLKVVITTNGTKTDFFLNLVLCLSESQRRNLEVRVSLDGPENICDSLRGRNVYRKAISSIEAIKSKLGFVAVNSVVGLEVDIPSWIDFYNVLSRLNVNELAIITFSPRGRGGEFNYYNKDIHLNTNKVKLLSKNSNFRGRILVWDYLSIEHGYLLVEHDGNVILPGLIDSGDIFLGSLKSISTKEVSHALVNLRKTLNYSYSYDQKKN
ncbi:radical SAM protein [Methylomonas methanica]|uniref:Radical SAM domain protein n=1 Tax=Methylomonas methanica (strain DSM 25384 / MC09) TaxID=857087 RepID=F9ZXU6_METMM|nr:radical SAM protein [Methylomonas methanica]AEF98525.1 Radical SAM domain protein [Methylomonas methanica MC09]